MTAYFENTRTGRKYQIVSFNKEAGTITLQGEHGPFTENYDKAHFEKMGYVIKKEELTP